MPHTAEQAAERAATALLLAQGGASPEAIAWLTGGPAPPIRGNFGSVEDIIGEGRPVSQTSPAPYYTQPIPIIPGIPIPNPIPAVPARDPITGDIKPVQVSGPLIQPFATPERVVPIDRAGGIAGVIGVSATGPMQLGSGTPQRVFSGISSGGSMAQAIVREVPKLLKVVSGFAIAQSGRISTGAGGGGIRGFAANIGGFLGISAAIDYLGIFEGDPDQEDLANMVQQLVEGGNVLMPRSNPRFQDDSPPMYFHINLSNGQMWMSYRHLTGKTLSAQRKNLTTPRFRGRPRPRGARRG